MKDYLIEIDGVLINLAQMLCVVSKNMDSDPNKCTMYMSGGGSRDPFSICICMPIDKVNKLIKDKVWPHKVNP
jgi:hypothetical protein